MTRTIHIIGAGLAGLSAAVRLAGSSTRIVVHEATDHPGGRCRSYHDQKTGMTIDNGNHLLLSGNRAALAYADAIGTRSRLVGPDSAEFPFIDLKSDERWTLRFNEGRLPWWIFDAKRRVPDTTPADYLRLVPLMWASGNKTVGETIDCSGTLYDRLLNPLLVAALNIETPNGAAALASAIVRETLGTGGAACRPLIARDGLGHAFIAPAIDHLAKRDVAVRLKHEVRALHFDDTRAIALEVGDEVVELSTGDVVIAAVPAYAAMALLPGLQAPSAFRAIVNAHFKTDPPPGCLPMIGVLNATVEWIFAFPGRLSVTISAADHLLDESREELAQKIWQEVSRVTGATGDLPPWQIVRERRATFAATPEENVKRPGTRTQWSNVVLAGDWTNTGLPATIEGAIRSGYSAAEAVQG